ncbi:hypothetical protein Daus18300_008033 [Diaporthe australafricana]|uniref:Fido domain-containing protein n=1 Tax=Diaporthe australafricana TaxID=127596 RepID=A0ABR3WK17_9PEZI
MASMPTQPSLLESAVASPVNQHHYTSTSDVFHLAAVLAQKVMLNHSFSDGNKRTSVVAADMFLRQNGYQLTPGGETEPRSDGVAGKQKSCSTASVVAVSLADTHVAVASGQWDEGELARFYEAVARPVGAQRGFQSDATT